MSIAFDSAHGLAKKIRGKEISSRELTDLYIGRIERYDDDINAVVVRDFDRGRAAADAADAALARGEALGPLHGVPMTIKEAYDIEGLHTTWGIPAFKSNVASSDAESVARFKAAGAHFIGKTNVPVQLSDFQSYNEIYGTTNNPWNLERIPGGSSGGSSAALAAGFCALEAGSDIGGSIRNPAHFCGVYGHKPTWNIVPQRGHSLPGMYADPDIAVVGPLARSAEDLALALDLTSGPGALVERGWKLELPPPRRKSLSEFRVVLWPDEGIAPVSREVADRVQSVGEKLAALGATVSDRARPAIDPGQSHSVYQYMLQGAMSAGIPDQPFAGMQAYAATLDPSDQSDGATVVRATVQTHREWVRQNNQRTRLRMAWQEFFQEWDLVICPQSPRAAFPHDHSEITQRTLEVDGVAQPYFQQLFWAGLVTVAYLPSTVFPTGPSAEGLPIGLQAFSGEYEDRTCIEFARLIEKEIGGFVPPPGY